MAMIGITKPYWNLMSIATTPTAAAASVRPVTSR